MCNRNAIVLELMKVVMVHAGVTELQLIEGESSARHLARYISQVS